MRRILPLLLVLVACSSGAGQPSPPSSVAPVSTTTAAQESSTTTVAVIAPTTTTSVPALDPAGSIDRMVADLAALGEIGPRVAGTAQERAAADVIVASLGGLAQATRLPVSLPNGDVSANIEARFGNGEKTVLLGAHYDTVTGSPGADDNGSGSVILLELARRLAAEPLPELTVVLVWFGAEEILPGFERDDHHFGSRAYVAGGGTADLMVSVDMVGWGDDLAAVYLRESDPSAALLVTEVAAGLGQTVVLREAGAISDHEPFALAGVPSVMLWRPDNPAYHTPADDSARPELLAATLDLVVAILESQRTSGP